MKWVVYSRPLFVDEGHDFGCRPIDTWHWSYWPYLKCTQPGVFCWTRFDCLLENQGALRIGKALVCAKATRVKAIKCASYSIYKTKMLAHTNKVLCLLHTNSYTAHINWVLCLLHTKSYTAHTDRVLCLLHTKSYTAHTNWLLCLLHTKSYTAHTNRVLCLLHTKSYTAHTNQVLCLLHTTGVPCNSWQAWEERADASLMVGCWMVYYKIKQVWISGAFQYLFHILRSILYPSYQSKNCAGSENHPPHWFRKSKPLWCWVP